MTSTIDSAQELSIHGWPKLITAPTWKRKVIWLLCCGVALGYFIYFAREIIISHLKRETYATIKVTPKKEMPLPAINFCNTNFGDLTDPLAESPIFQTMPVNCSNYSSSHFINNKNEEFFQIGCKMFMAASSSPVGFKRSTKIRFPQQFNFLPFSWPCFTLNKNEKFKQRDPSERDGIRIILFYNQTERSRVITNYSDFLIKDERRGIYVDIHDPAEYYNKAEGIYLMPGHQTFISVKKTTVIRLESPFSDCLNEDKNPQEIVIPGKYTADSCRFECFSKNIYKKCGLLPPAFRSFFNQSMLRQKDTLTKRSNTQCYFKKAFAYDTSECDCRSPCKKIIFEKNVKYNQWPQEWQLETLAPMFSEVTKIPEKDVTIELLRKHLIYVAIYYGEMSETESRQVEAYGGAKVLSDFGGQMGIFLGASFISIIEIVLFLFTALWERLREKTKKSMQVKSDRSGDQ